MSSQPIHAATQQKNDIQADNHNQYSHEHHEGHAESGDQARFGQLRTTPYAERIATKPFTAEATAKAAVAECPNDGHGEKLLIQSPDRPSDHAQERHMALDEILVTPGDAQAWHKYSYVPNAQRAERSGSGDDHKDESAAQKEVKLYPLPSAESQSAGRSAAAPPRGASMNFKQALAEDPAHAHVPQVKVVPEEASTSDEVEGDDEHREAPLTKGQLRTQRRKAKKAAKQRGVMGKIADFITGGEHHAKAHEPAAKAEEDDVAKRQGSAAEEEPQHPEKKEGIMATISHLFTESPEAAAAKPSQASSSPGRSVPRTHATTSLTMPVSKLSDDAQRRVDTQRQSASSAAAARSGDDAAADEHSSEEKKEGRGGLLGAITHFFVGDSHSTEAASSDARDDKEGHAAADAHHAKPSASHK